VLLGSNVTFSVIASSLLPLNYEWFFNGNPVPNATNATLTMTNVETTASGDYSVLVSSAAGTVTSDIATLSVIVPPPVITASAVQHIGATRIGCDFLRRGRESSASDLPMVLQTAASS
jgi:hypothetical protein